MKWLMMLVTLSNAGTLFSAEQFRADKQRKLEILDKIFGKELYAVAHLSRNAQTNEAKIAVQEKKSEQFVAVMKWAYQNVSDQDQAEDLVRELEECQTEEKKE